MTTRARPALVVCHRAAITGDGGRPYMRPADAYYQIARRLVCDRYPLWLVNDSGDGGIEAIGECYGWSAEKTNARAARIERLFFDVAAMPPQPFFSPKLWQRLIWRLARFLAFVDKRRALEHDTADELDAEFARCEAAAGVFMQRCADILKERRRRSLPSDPRPTRVTGES